MKKKLFILFILMTSTFLLGCGKGEEESKTLAPTSTNAPTPTIVATTAPTPTPILEAELPEGYVKSRLSGLNVEEEIGNKRPYALVFNNIEYASPHSGIEEADILYEAIVEGGITRLLGIFEQLHESRIGSVRSARHYFVSFADEHDAVFVHFGETTYATKKIKKLAIDNISGLTSVGDKVFYRDKSIKEPHNVFTSKERLEKGMELKGHQVFYDEEYEGVFRFNPIDTPLVSEETVDKLILEYSNYTSPYFTYNQESKEYERYQFGIKHVDANSNKQLSFKNIIVQFVKQWDIDKNDYQTMDIEKSSGEGYYISNGNKVNITWTKNESNREMNYYDMSGNELLINPGKTFISIFPNDRISDVILQ